MLCTIKGIFIAILNCYQLHKNTHINIHFIKIIHSLFSKFCLGVGQHILTKKKQLGRYLISGILSTNTISSVVR